MDIFRSTPWVVLVRSAINLVIAVAVVLFTDVFNIADWSDTAGPIGGLVVVSRMLEGGTFDWLWGKNAKEETVIGGRGHVTEEQ